MAANQSPYALEHFHRAKPIVKGHYKAIQVIGEYTKNIVARRPDDIDATDVTCTASTHTISIPLQ